MVARHVRIQGSRDRHHGEDLMDLGESGLLLRGAGDATSLRCPRRGIKSRRATHRMPADLCFGGSIPSSRRRDQPTGAVALWPSPRHGPLRNPVEDRSRPIPLVGYGSNSARRRESPRSWRPQVLNALAPSAASDSPISSVLERCTSTTAQTMGLSQNGRVARSR